MAELQLVINNCPSEDNSIKQEETFGLNNFKEQTTAEKPVDILQQVTQNVIQLRQKMKTGCYYFLCNVTSSTVTTVNQINPLPAGKSSQSSCGETAVGAR